MFKVPVTNEDVPYFKIVAYRDGYDIEFTMEGEDDDCLTDIAVIGADETVKEEFLEDVKCEKQSTAYGGIPVYSLRTVSNPEKLERLMKLNHTRTFIPLKEEADVYLEM